jgi:hypothetical protein
MAAAVHTPSNVHLSKQNASVSLPVFPDHTPPLPPISTSAVPPALTKISMLPPSRPLASIVKSRIACDVPKGMEDKRGKARVGTVLRTKWTIPLSTKFGPLQGIGPSRPSQMSEPLALPRRAATSVRTSVASMFGGDGLPGSVTLVDIKSSVTSASAPVATNIPTAKIPQKDNNLRKFDTRIVPSLSCAPQGTVHFILLRSRAHSKQHFPDYRAKTRKTRSRAHRVHTEIKAPWVRSGCYSFTIFQRTVYNQAVASTRRRMSPYQNSPPV